MVSARLNSASAAAPAAHADGFHFRASQKIKSAAATMTGVCHFIHSGNASWKTYFTSAGKIAGKSSELARQIRQTQRGADSPLRPSPKNRSASITASAGKIGRSEEHTSELQSLRH